MKTLVAIFSIMALLNYSNLFSADMWKFKPLNQEVGFYKEAEFLNSKKVVKINHHNRGYSIYWLDNNELTKISNKTVDENLHALSELKSVGNRLIVSSGNNSLFEYKNGEWNTFQYDDRFNHKDSLEMRRMNRIVEFNGKIHCLSYAYKLKSLDTLQSGSIQYISDTVYNEIFIFDGNKLDLLIQSSKDQVGYYYDITADEDFIWIIGRELNKLKDGKIIESYDIASIAGLNNHTVFYKIASSGKYIYLLKDFDPSSENREPLLLRFHKETNETKIYQFPLYESYGDEKYEVFPEL